MTTLPLARLLLEVNGEPHYKLAESIKTTPSMLSRVSNGVLKSRSDVLQKLAAYFSQKLSTEVDSDLLCTRLGPRDLVGLSFHLRSKQLSQGIAS